MPEATAAGRTTRLAMKDQPRTWPAKPPRFAMGRTKRDKRAMRSPKAKGTATAIASTRQMAANPPSVAANRPRERSDPCTKLPAPIPKSATARMVPKLNTVPPRSGPSMRYQTISMRKKAKPTTADATRTKLGGALAAFGSDGAGSDLFDAMVRDRGRDD